MSYHIIDVSTEGVTLSVKHRQLVCRSRDGTEKSLPIEDIGAVIINSFSALLHNSFLAAAAEERVAVLICDHFKPKSLVMPITRGTDTLLTRTQISSSAKFRDSIWRKTVDAKTANQYVLACRIAPDHTKIRDLLAVTKRNDANKEGNCARLYWDVFSDTLGVHSFRRLRDGDGLNSLLNYGYGVLLCRVLQKMLAFGLDPMYGVGHSTRERAAPLAYDVMEPFRVSVDNAVYHWVSKRSKSSESLVVDRAYKEFAHGIMKQRYAYRTIKAIALESILELVLKSLRDAYISGKAVEYRPWIWRSSEWDG